MGLIFQDNMEIREKIKKDFGNLDNHLLAMKHNDTKTDFAKLIMSTLFHTLDSTRTFILYFSQKGIHEEEISNSAKRDFLLMPWHEISSFNVEVKKDKAILEFLHLGKRMGYEIPFHGKIFNDNEKNFNSLQAMGWNKIEDE